MGSSERDQTRPALGLRGYITLMLWPLALSSAQKSEIILHLRREWPFFVPDRPGLFFRSLCTISAESEAAVTIGNGICVPTQVSFFYSLANICWFTRGSNSVANAALYVLNGASKFTWLCVYVYIFNGSIVGLYVIFYGFD